MMLAALQASRTVTTLPYTRKQYEALEDAISHEREKKITKMLEDLEAQLNETVRRGKVTPEVGKHYHRAYRQYAPQML